MAGLRLEKLGQSLASTRRGAWIRQKLIADHQWFTGLPGWKQFLRKGSAVVGTMIILGGASHLAAESGIPGAVLLVDILSELTGEEILFDILSRAGTPARNLLARVDDVLEFAAKKQDDLARFGRSLDDLEDITAKVRANKGKVTKQTRNRLNGICQASRYDPHRQWRKGLPPLLGNEVDLARGVRANRSHGGEALLLLTASSASLISGCPAVGVLGNAIPGTAEEAAGKAMQDVIQALQRGDVAEAQRALRAANDLKAVSEGQLKKLTAKVNRAKQVLARIKGRQAEVVTEQLSIIKQTQAKRFTDPDFYAGSAGRHVLQGDELLRQGEFDEALKSYRAAKKHGDAERDPEAFCCNTQSFFIARVMFCRRAGCFRSSRWQRTFYSQSRFEGREEHGRRCFEWRIVSVCARYSKRSHNTCRADKGSGLRVIQIGDADGQYAAVMGLKALIEASADPQDRKLAQLEGSALEKALSFPLAALGWQDIQTFIHHYNEWLFDPEHPERLENMPRLNQAPGFVRLPNELEWEYATRGGDLAMRAKTFNERLPFDASKLRKHTWHLENAKHKTRPIGLREPNLLGLYDTLGNVQELMSGRFQPEIWQGKPGGLTARGGSVSTPASRMRSSYREEVEIYYWDPDRKAVRQRRSFTTGIRLAIGSNVVVDSKLRASLVSEYSSYQQEIRRAMPVGMTLDNPVAQAATGLGSVQEILEDLMAKNPALQSNFRWSERVSRRPSNSWISASGREPEVPLRTLSDTRATSVVTCSSWRA